MRRQFQLPEDDIVYLNQLGFQWETINDQGMQWVIIHDFPIAPGYNIDKACIAVKIETGYPRAALDMAYLFPNLIRKDNKAINAITNQLIDGKQYQRWSRHRTAENPWREGIDDLSSHMSLVNYWFEEEFIKKPYGIPT